MFRSQVWIRLWAVGLLLTGVSFAQGQEASTVIEQGPSLDATAPEAPSLPTTGSPETNSGEARESKDEGKTESAPEGTTEDAAGTSTPTPVPAPTLSPTPLSLTPDERRRYELRELVDRAITETSRRKLTAGVHTPWQVVHGILALRWDLMLLRGKGMDDISGIEWITSGAMHDGLPLWEETRYGGRGHPFTKPYAFEGHPSQFMGYMTMANIPLDYEIKTPTKVITIRDIINDAKMQVNEGVEITWTLWALAHYENPDATWINAMNVPWSIEKLVKMQVDEPVTSGACGGTHGLFAISYARNSYIWFAHANKKSPTESVQLRGVWLEADQKIKRYIYEARALQNSDGSFSSNHFKGPGFNSDFPTRIATSGHQLEWLMVALTENQLKEEWVERGITAVAKDLIENRHTSSDCGPLYHALHGLVIYRQRTNPAHREPKFNSHIKLTERGKKKPATDAKPPSRSAEGKSKERVMKTSAAKDRPMPAATEDELPPPLDLERDAAKKK
jgi:hypothetical protein